MKFRTSRLIGIVVAAAMGVAAVAPAHAADEIAPDTTNTVLITDATGGGDEVVDEVRVESTGPGDAVVTTQVTEEGGFEGEAAAEVENGLITSIAVEYEAEDGVQHSDVLAVQEFARIGTEDFQATLRSQNTGETIVVDTTTASQQAVPVLILLGILARLGIKYVLKWYGKAQLKKAAKSYMLNNINAQRWAHIWRPDHLWHEVGANSREQIAEIVGSAMADGNHRDMGGHMLVDYSYKGRTIQVQYNKSGGQIGDAWVKRR